MRTKFLKIGLAMGLLLAVFAQRADAAAGHSHLYTNAVKDGIVSYYTNYGASFKMMFPGDDSYRIDVPHITWKPTNLFASTLAIYTGDTVSGLATTVAGASGDSALSVGSTNGFALNLKCVVQLSNNRCIMLTVSNVLTGQIGFNETLGFTVPVGSKIYQMNRSNVWINDTTNSIPIPQASVGRYKYPLLIEQSDGGYINVKLNYTP